MKISLVAPHFYPETGGMETNILEISKALAGRGFEIEVHTSSKTTAGKTLDAAGEIDGIHIKRYKPVFSFGYYATLIKPKIGDFDVLHLHAYGYYTHNGLISKYRGKPIVFTPHHGAAMPRKGGMMEGMFHRYYQWSFGRRLKYLSRVIMMTDAEKEWYAKRGMPEEKLVTIPSGVDESAFAKADSSGILDKHGIVSDGYLLYLGRLHEEKSVDHLINAFEMKYPEYPDLKLVIAGPDAGEGKKLRELVKSESIGDRVVFTGRVSDDQKRALLGNCALFVLPSRFEAEGVVLLEAMAQGRAVVASRVGGVPRIVRDGKTGLLYDYGDIDALARNIGDLLDDPEKRAKLGNAAREHVRKNFRWEVIVDKMEKMYRDVVKP